MATAAYTSGYRQFSFNDLSAGLNLRDKADAVKDGEAIDLLNVQFTERGAIQQRAGYVDHTPADLSSRVDSLSPFYTAAGARRRQRGRDGRRHLRAARRAVGVRPLRRPDARVPLRGQRAQHATALERCHVGDRRRAGHRQRRA
jgi:hypothetical protein